MNIKKYAEEFIWAQAYRPKTLEDVVLPDDVAANIRSMIDKKELLHSIFSGPPGMGKTTLVQVIINELDADYLYINGSAERGIDAIRHKITNYASSMSLDGGKKIVFIDEGDQLTADAQLALRAVMETFSSNTVFFITANFPDKISDALRSRCQEIRFDVTAQKAELMKKMAVRCVAILKNENVEFDKSAIMAIVKAKFPDMRSIVNLLQQHGLKGKIDASIIDKVRTTSMDALIGYLADKKFKDMHKWVLENVQDPVQFVSELWYVSEQKVESKSLPYFSVFLDDCQDRLTRVPDRHLTLIATLTKCMAECNFIKEK